MINHCMYVCIYVCMYVTTTTFTSWLVVAAWSTGLCCSNLEGKCSLGGPAGRPVIGPNSDHHTLPTLPLMNVSECLLVVGGEVSDLKSPMTLSWTRWQKTEKWWQQSESGGGVLDERFIAVLCCHWGYFSSLQAFVISFTSEFVPRMVYQYMYSANGTMTGYTEHSLSYFNISNFPTSSAPTSTLITGVSMCRLEFHLTLTPAGFPLKSFSPSA